MDNKTTFIQDLTEGDRFYFPNHPKSVYTVEGVGTMGNLTRVTYWLGSDRFVFTKVNLTSVVVL